MNKKRNRREWYLNQKKGGQGKEKKMMTERKRNRMNTKEQRENRDRN